ncbi:MULTISPECIES: hypothetical protein [Bradyrhizobium]|uniref:Uncharacterized protein n=2 Tax=Bradyrhizobium TaxID=374 RepID=A0ABY0Q980_9BRAD|nr:MULTISPECIES: hypothetical protein [Bradyrhizobium]SDJ72829.1 hypothetical protein SAMN05444163_6282 [Bradyrhizobium ottawaense]SEC20179.1 hypothetical protein SAMN05444171_0877 [Bradyrhizobium lablabi]
MRVDIVNDNQNWLNWGTLVQIWIADASQRPTTVGDLKAQMVAHCVDGNVAGPDNRPVQIRSYINGPNDPLMIMLPTKQMADDRLATVGRVRFARRTDHLDLRQIGTTGKFPLSPSRKSLLELPPSCPTRGALAIVADVGAGSGGRGSTRDERTAAYGEVVWA